MLHLALIFLHFLSSPLTGIPVETIDIDNPRYQLVTKAKSLIGSPYRYSGSTAKGFDCSGFTQYVYKSALDIKLKRSSDGQATLGKKVKPKNAIPGDLIFFKKKGKIFHVALIVENKSDKLIVIHATSSKGVILEDLNKSQYWKQKKSLIKRII